MENPFEYDPGQSKTEDEKYRSVKLHLGNLSVFILN